MNRSRREELELRLAEGGAEALEHDAELRAWVESDDEALALFEAMVVLDRSFDAMSEDTLADEAADAPDELVAALLARPELAEPVAMDPAAMDPTDDTVADKASRGSLLSWPRWLRLRWPGLRWPSPVGWRLQMGVAMAAVVVTSAFLWTRQGAAPEGTSEQHVLVYPQSSTPRFEPPPASVVPAPAPAPASEEERAAREQMAERRDALTKELKALGYVGYEQAGVKNEGALEERIDELEERAEGEVPRIDGLTFTDEVVIPQEGTVVAQDGVVISKDAVVSRDKSERRPERDEEAIRVTSESPLLDSRRIAEGSAVGAKELEKIPTARDPWALQRTVPGVETDRVNVGGNESGSANSASAESNSVDSSTAKRKNRAVARFAAEYGADIEAGDEADEVAIGGFEGGKTDTDAPVVGGRIAGEAAEKKQADRPARQEVGRPQTERPQAESPETETPSPAADFLAERHRTEGLVFQAAAGYWRNPWLPGDPELRFLAARMDELAPSLPAGLHELARRPGLPFDPPADDALALFLHADRTVADGPARVALRVGVRAADAWAGRRTAMNLAVVLHLPPADEEIPAETAASLRALLEALADAHDLGDRFQIVVAGRPGGLLVPADAFRRGAVLVAARNLLQVGAGDDADGAASAGTDNTAQILDLATALAAAGEQVKPGANGEDDDPVGSSAVLVVTTGTDARALAGAASEAHRLSVAGVRVSAFGVGPGAAVGAVPETLARLADAGQGSRRLVARPADATPAIEGELAQAARAVARAVRLRIRPAPGVRLVGVFDSEPLSAPAAERVREAEQALDLRLAHKLGIESDRGDDEEGIQIVVPALYAGDAMTLLIDLVAPGPGPLADVTVRYKDLVRMDNGVARARLDLAYGEPSEVANGPLEVSVLKSLLAHEVKDCLETAARRLETEPARSVEDARKVLGTCRDLLRGLAIRVPALDGDHDVERDLRMLEGYLSALASDPSSESVSAVRQSLHYAGKLKTLPPPESAETTFD